MVKRHELWKSESSLEDLLYHSINTGNVRDYLKKQRFGNLWFLLLVQRGLNSTNIRQKGLC